MKINGIENLSAAQIKSEIERGGKFVQFHWCVSFVVLSFKRVSEVYFIKAGESGASKGMKYTLLALFLGWWGIPFGILWTIQSLLFNLSGGENVTKQVMTFLDLSKEEKRFASPQQITEQEAQPMQKTCPKCAEKIQLEALVCRYCGNQFPESEVQAMKTQIEAQAQEAKRLAEAQEQEAKQIADENAARAKILQKKKSRRNSGWILVVLGGLAVSFGGLCSLLNFGAYLTSSTETPYTLTTAIVVLIICAAPFLLGGGAMLGGGVYIFRKAKRLSEEIDSHPAQPTSKDTHVLAQQESWRGESTRPSRVAVTLKDPGFLLNNNGIDFLLDGRGQGLMQFGDTKEFEVPPGEHVANVILHGVVDRSSKELKFSLREGQTVRIEGGYSRAWGNMSISLV